ncbi:MAG: OadG family protein [Woeseiaceae bacterium]|nr:OadG family protein [Woeseiaceae bacterium]
MEGDLIGRGVELMLVGMGTVFVFLTLLVGATTLMSGFVDRYLPAPDTTATQPGDGPTAEEVAAIAVAIARHRNPSS